MIFSQHSPKFPVSSSCQKLPRIFEKKDSKHPSPQEHQASIQNEEPVCFTEDQIYEIQPEVLQEQIDNIMEKNKQICKTLNFESRSP